MRVRIDRFGSSLMSRPRATKIRETLLSDLGEDARLELDFSGVQTATPSFLDELVGELITMRDASQLSARVETIGALPTIQAHLDDVVARRTSGTLLSA